MGAVPVFRRSQRLLDPLSAAHWVALGRTVNAVHGASLPADPLVLMPCERYSPRSRGFVSDLQRRISRQEYSGPIASRFAALWETRHDEISRIVGRAGLLAAALRDRRPDLVVCHADLHGGNVLVGDGDDLTIVDWGELSSHPGSAT